MDRIITYQMGPEQKRMRISQYLRSRSYSRQNLIELKKYEGSIQVNGQPRRLNEFIGGGDCLRVWIRERDNTPVTAVPLPVSVIYEDDDLLVVDKPAGMPVHPSFQNTDNTLANALAWYYREKGTDFVFRCSNRLDRDTSGLTVVAKHFVSGNMLSEMGVRHDLRREYLAIVHGRELPERGTVDAPLGRKEGSLIERCVDPEKGERAVTHYQVLDCRNGYSLVRLVLETGRTHQIRIHMKYLGCPLVGDYLYGEEEVSEVTGAGRQALHSALLAFTHPITGEALRFCAPLPRDMRDLCDRLGLCVPPAEYFTCSADSLPRAGRRTDSFSSPARSEECGENC